jgi:hypothetical protein
MERNFVTDGIHCPPTTSPCRRDNFRVSPKTKKSLVNMTGIRYLQSSFNFFPIYNCKKVKILWPPVLVISHS